MPTNNTNGWIDAPDDVMAVESEVGVFGAAANFLTGTGAGKIRCLHDSYNKINIEFPYRNQGPVGSCFTAGQKVLLSDGQEKNIEDIQIGDVVVTHLNNHKKVTNIFSRKYTGNLLLTETKKNKLSIISTPDHEFFNGMIFKRIDQIYNEYSGRKGDRIQIQFPRIEESCNDFDMSLLCDNCIHVSKTKIRLPRSSKLINRYISYDEDLCWLIGMFAAEGGYEKSRHGEYSRVTFTINLNEIEYAKRIHQIILDKFNLECVDSFKEESLAQNIRCVSKLLCKFFQYHITGKCLNKDITHVIHKLPRHLKISFLTGYFNGDGHYSTTKNRITVVSASNKLLRSVQKLCYQIKVSTSFGIRPEYKQSKKSYSLNIYGEDILIFGHTLKTNINNRNKFSDNGVLLKIKNQTVINAVNTEVYCLEVEEDHSFICNGFAVHNCVAFGAAGGTDILKATEIADGDRETFKAPTAEEPIYYGARVVIGQNRIRGDGAIVAYAIKYMAEYGTIAKGKYGNIDISEYSPERCRKWGTGSGFPKTIESISKETVIQAYSRVKSWEEARDSIYNGNPVVFGSSYGFASETDNEGFCRQNTTWQHCMMMMAMDDLSQRKGGLISNSWGRTWLKIRKRKLNQPDGCFWADADVIDKIMRNGDAWSISQFKGYKREINTDISW